MQTQSSPYEHLTADELFRIVDTGVWDKHSPTDATNLVMALAGHLEDFLEAKANKEPIGGYEHN